MTNILDKSTQKTREWLHGIEKLVGWKKRDESRALAFLRATLNELRDNLPLGNLAHFSSQLPLMIRGLLFEGWMPSKHLKKERTRDEFLRRVYSHLPSAYKENDAEEIVLGVLQILVRKIDQNEVLKMQKVLPHGIRQLFVNAVGNECCELPPDVDWDAFEDGPWGQ